MQITINCPECDSYETHKDISDFEKRTADLELDTTYLKCPNCSSYHTHEELRLE